MEKNFALLIRQEKKDDGSTQMMVKSENQGIPDSEVILIVEAWLEKVKEHFKNKIMGEVDFEKK